MIVGNNTKGKNRDGVKPGLEGVVEGHWEAKPRNLDSKVQQLIVKAGGSQMQDVTNKMDGSPPRMKIEQMVNPKIKMSLNPTFIVRDSSMEVEVMEPDLDFRIDMEELFDVNATMPGRDSLMEAILESAKVRSAILEDVTMAGCSSAPVVEVAVEDADMRYVNYDLGMLEGGGSASNHGVSVVDPVGMIGDEPRSSRKFNSLDGTLGGCNNAAVGSASESMEKGKGLMGNRSSLFSDGDGNAWSRPEHIPIRNPEEINAISADEI